MNKKIVLASIILSAFLLVFATNVVDSAPAPKPMKGKIVSLEDVIKSKKDLQLTKDKAKELRELGVPLVFQYNKKIYFVQHEDGAFAFNKLADYAHNKNIGIVGKIKTVNGINVIIMSKIESMD